MKYNHLFSLTIAFLFAGFFSSCEKKEQPIILPPSSGSAVPGRVIMGENYDTQVFYDFETNSVVKTSEAAVWDLAFEADKNGYHVWMNGGKGVLIANTHLTDIKSFTTLPSNITTASFTFDDPSGRGDSTAVRDWQDAADATKGEVYIAKLNDTAYYKFTMDAVNDTAYTISCCPLNTTNATSLSLKKDDNYSYIYYSFSSGVVMPDPPKNTWDIVFTRYRYIYRDLNNLPYYVNGAILNPYNTAVSADSTHTFASITADAASLETASTNRDAIGFDWKRYNFTTARYEVNTAKNYILHTRNSQVIKLHFLDFYSTTGVKGSPSFESERLQ